MTRRFVLTLGNSDHSAEQLQEIISDAMDYELPVDDTQPIVVRLKSATDTAVAQQNLDAVVILLRAKSSDEEWARYPDRLRDAVALEYAKLREDLARLTQERDGGMAKAAQLRRDLLSALAREQSLISERARHAAHCADLENERAGALRVRDLAREASNRDLEAKRAAEAEGKRLRDALAVYADQLNWACSECDIHSGVHAHVHDAWVPTEPGWEAARAAEVSDIKETNRV